MIKLKPHGRFVKILVPITFVISFVLAQTSLGQDKVAQQAAAETVLATYAKWRTSTLLNFPQGLLTPHYAVVIAAQRLDDSTAQVEVLIAAEMKQYTVSIKPVTLNRLPSGEAESKPAGNTVTIDQKAGDKLGTGSDKIRIGQTTTTVPISKAVQALESPGLRRTTTKTISPTPASCVWAKSLKSWSTVTPSARWLGKPHHWQSRCST